VDVGGVMAKWFYQSIRELPNHRAQFPFCAIHLVVV